MIKINKLPCPPELTPQVQANLTREYQQSGKAVWKQKYIESALLKSSHSKCCYCECKLMEESKYLEIDHYYDKDHHPNLVIDWDNLLPSCKRCNGTKSNFDTMSKPFINPSTLNPKDHLFMRSFRYYGKTAAGKSTIVELDLNDSRKLVKPRFDIAEAIQTQVSNLEELVKDYINGKKTTSYYQKKIVSIAKNLLHEAQPESAYAATVATELINNIDFASVVDFIKANGLWDAEIDQQFSTAQQLSLPYTP